MLEKNASCWRAANNSLLFNQQVISLWQKSLLWEEDYQPGCFFRCEITKFPASEARLGLPGAGGWWGGQGEAGEAAAAAACQCCSTQRAQLCNICLRHWSQSALG